MADEFHYDVFLSHSSKDKEVVREVAERLRKDGVRVWFDEWELEPGDSIPAKIEAGLERSRVLVLCMSASAFGSDWAQLESGTFRFRDPLNKERRFIPLRLDETVIKGSLAQFLYINWLPKSRDQEYAKLVEACRSAAAPEAQTGRGKDDSIRIFLGHTDAVNCVRFKADGLKVVSGSWDRTLRYWDVASSQCLQVLKGHRNGVRSIDLSASGHVGISGSGDKPIRLWNLERGQFIRTLNGHTATVNSVRIASDGQFALSASNDCTLRLWQVDNGKCLSVLHGHDGPVYSIELSPDEDSALSGAADGTLRLWDLSRGRCVEVFTGHKGSVECAKWSPDGRHALSGSRDGTLRLWNLRTGQCLRVFEGHLNAIHGVEITPDGNHAITCSHDATLRVWDLHDGRCIHVWKGHKAAVYGLSCNIDGTLVVSGSWDQTLRLWDLSAVVKVSRHPEVHIPACSLMSGQVEYTNAKVLLVGDTHAGKTGLTHRLATGEWVASADSTVGAWSTQFKLEHGKAESTVDREIWLWDFGGQADQRLIHQLYMDRTALVLLLFNADQEDVLPGLRDWMTALRRSFKKMIPHFLVAGRIDTGFKASRGKLQAFAKEQGLAYHETSAKSGDGCDELRTAMIAGIPWAQMEKRTSPGIFKLIKDEILKLRDQGRVLHTFKELRELLWQRLPDEPRFTDETLQTVIGLLDGPGVVKELDYGTYILLAPEWINAYAQAVIRTLRSADNDLGVMPLRSIAEGKLIYQSIGRDGVPIEMKRLHPPEERVVLGEMERQLEQRGLCLRQGAKLVFPSHCGRDRPAVLEHPSVFVSYAVKGFLDDVYATLVVKLADSESFQLKELWRDAADFVTLEGDRHMGLKLTRESGSDGIISIYFGKGVTQQEQVIFANYIHAHLQTSCEQSQRLRHYVCPKCHVPKGNAEVLMKKLLREKEIADTECDDCGERFPLWDALEKKFASDAVRAQVEQLEADDLAKLTERRKGKLLVLDVGARITSANQKWIEIPGDEDDGIDLLLEFTDDDGNGIGNKGLCLQLKAGNSHLTKRKTDGAEIFAIKKQRWVKTWMNQTHPVMLVIGTFSEADNRTIGKEKLEFTEVRWMEITSVLKRLSENGVKPVKQIEFKGERLDLSSVRRWREKILVSTPT